PAPATDAAPPEPASDAAPPEPPVQQGGGAPAPHSRRQIVLVFAGLILAVLISALDQTIVSTALPTIVGDLHGLDHLSWVITAYLLTSTIGLPIYGKLGDLLGRKNIFIFAIFVFLLGSALSGQANSMAELIAYRALQGVGGGGLMIGAQSIIPVELRAAEPILPLRLFKIRNFVVCTLVGLAVYGSVFISRLNDQLADAPVAVRGVTSQGVNSISPAQLKTLPPPVRDFIADAFGSALPPIFLLGIPALAAAFVLTLFIRPIPLSTEANVQLDGEARN
ncbi:MFS transporter, partial [Arthrobacter sp.]|uniref:MFS transporter n=1 Tax=Arthrobacter sp. TaxID=1667 RepID=UPI0028972996